MQGHVKFFNEQRGYGFVHNEAGSWWFHRTYCIGDDAPAAGDEVEFWLDDGKRGDLVAVNVTVTSPHAANGALRDMVCRSLLLMLHRAGEIELPQVRFVARNPLVERERPAPVLLDTTPVIARLDELRPLEMQQVRRSGDEPLFNSLHNETLARMQSPAAA